MNRSLKYDPLPIYDTKDGVEKVLKNGNKTDLMKLSLGVAQSFPDWKYAQEVCLQLAEHEDADIRANACQGLAYVARFKGQLDREAVEPILLREFKSQENNRAIVADAIWDVNYFLKWDVGEK